jgi:hypothetical protein
MYERILRNDTHTRRFTVTSAKGLGWDIREFIDREITNVVRHADWHRVERAKRTFARLADDLRKDGWIDISRAGGPPMQSA